jgi:hypothetical protein
MILRKAPSYVLALGLTVLLFFSFTLYGHLNFYRDPGSIFFNPSRALERSYSAHRDREALSFRDHASSQFHSGNRSAEAVFRKAGKNPTLCGVFVTMGRDNHEGVNPLEVRFPDCLI